jgi:transcription elongation factor GreA
MADTSIGHDERHALLDELAMLRRRRHALVQSFEGDDEYRDWGDLGERTGRREELDRVHRRIREVIYLLHAVAREQREAKQRAKEMPDRVGIDSEVTLRYSDGTTETRRVVAVPDPDMPEVTPDSPLGRALLGAEKGEEISWDAPAGRLRATIVEIRQPV